jgi:hypothetical protein
VWYCRQTKWTRKRLIHPYNARESFKIFLLLCSSYAAGLAPTVVCYCSLGYRSSRLADTIQKYLEDPSQCCELLD